MPAIAVNYHRRATVPATHEAQHLIDMRFGGRHEAVHRFVMSSICTANDWPRARIAVAALRDVGHHVRIWLAPVALTVSGSAASGRRGA